MPYFDSAKNRAIWERKLSVLREEKKRRQETGYVPGENTQGEKQRDEFFRRKINLEQLEKIEMETQGIRRVKRPVKAPQEQRKPGLEREQVMKGRQL